MPLVPGHGSELPARQQLAALLEARDPAAAVQAVPAPTLYAWVKEVGIGDAVDVLALAAPEQIQTCLDLDAWGGDHLRDADVRPWLAALGEAGPEELTRVWRELDPELGPLLLARWCRIYQLAEEEVPDWEEPPFVPTPDRYFMLKVTAEDGETVRLVEMLVDRLYRVDAVLARHSIRAAASEPAIELEDTLLRWRTGRMQDLGFAPFDEALEVYRPIDLGSVAIGEATADRAGDGTVLLPALAQPLAQAPFLSRALATISDPAELARLEGALALLLNKVLSANRVEPSDTVAASAASAYGAATLSLGLETLARGDVTAGGAALSSVALQRIHRVGWSILLSLAKLARAVAPRAAGADEADRALLSTLTAPRPRLADGRPLAEVADVRRATEALAALGARIQLVREILGHDPEQLGASHGAILRTAIVRASLDLPLDVARVTTAEARAYLAILAAGEDRWAPVREAFGRLADKRGVPLPREFASVMSGYRGELEAELGNLSPDDPPDPAILGEVLLFFSESPA